jgi:hypothetical protein
MQDNSSLDRLKANPLNPRTITPQKAKALKKALKKFGDLGGVVVNRRSGMLVSGHQRSEAFLASDNAKVDITLTYQAPTKTGTVAEGYVTIDGEKFSYREVDWDEKTAKAASIAANTNAGAFDMTGLTSWLNELNAEGLDLDLTMMSADELMPYLPSMDEEPSEAPAYVAPDSDDFDPETGEAHDSTMSRTQQVQVHDTAAGQVKAVQLFFDAKAHAKFIELTDVLKEVYGKDNLSDAVFEAVKRASVTAAVA